MKYIKKLFNLTRISINFLTLSCPTFHWIRSMINNKNNLYKISQITLSSESSSYNFTHLLYVSCISYIIQTFERKTKGTRDYTKRVPTPTTLEYND